MVTTKFQVVYHHIQDGDDQVPGSLPSHSTVRIQRGAGGPDPPPPGKSQVILVSIGNKQLDPPPPSPGKSWTPLENVGPPMDLKYDRFH